MKWWLNRVFFLHSDKKEKISCLANSSCSFWSWNWLPRSRSLIVHGRIGRSVRADRNPMRQLRALRDLYKQNLSRASARALFLKRSRRSPMLAHYVSQLCLGARSAHTKQVTFHCRISYYIYRFIASYILRYSFFLRFGLFSGIFEKFANSWP